MQGIELGERKGENTRAPLLESSEGRRAATAATVLGGCRSRAAGRGPETAVILPEGLETVCGCSMVES